MHILHVADGKAAFRWYLHYVTLCRVIRERQGRTGMTRSLMTYHPICLSHIFLLNRRIVRWFFVWAEKFHVFFLSLDNWFHLAKKLCVIAKVQICMTIKLLQIVGGAQQLAVALLGSEGNTLSFQEIVGKI